MAASYRCSAACATYWNPAALTRFSAPTGLGLVLRSTATSWRRTSSSMSLDDDARGSSVSKLKWPVQDQVEQTQSTRLRSCAAVDYRRSQAQADFWNPTGSPRRHPDLISNTREQVRTWQGDRTNFVRPRPRPRGRRARPGRSVTASSRSNRLSQVLPDRPADQRCPRRTVVATHDPPDVIVYRPARQMQPPCNLAARHPPCNQPQHLRLPLRQPQRTFLRHPHPTIPPRRSRPRVHGQHAIGPRPVRAPAKTGARRGLGRRRRCLRLDIGLAPGPTDFWRTGGTTRRVLPFAGLAAATG